MDWFGFLFNDISTFVGHLMAKPSLLKNCWSTISPIAGDKEVHAFPKGINLKVNEKVWLGFELTHYDIVVQDVSHYATDSPTYRWDSNGTTSPNHELGSNGNEGVHHNP